MAEAQPIDLALDLSVGNIDISFVGAEGTVAYLTLRGPGETTLKIPVTLEEAAALHGGTLERQTWKTSPIDARAKVRATIHLEIT